MSPQCLLYFISMFALSLCHVAPYLIIMSSPMHTLCNHCYFICRAREAGVTILNEVGVDPGIDHLLAVECFDDVKEHGGKVRNLKGMVIK